MSKSGRLEEHAQEMMQLQTWGTQVELQAAASLFQKELYVFTQLPSDLHYSWIRYEPHSPHQLVFPEEQFPKLATLTHFELCHTRNCHFDCILNNANNFAVELPNLPSTVSHVKSVL